VDINVAAMAAISREEPMSKTRWWAGTAFRLFLAAAVAVAVGGVAVAELVGNRSQLDPLFEELVGPLHKQGIDVVGGDTSEFALGAKSRPRIARLEGMPDTARAADWTAAAWMKDFASGASGFIAAIKPAGGATAATGAAPTSLEAFANDWKRAERKDKVFLSFTAADAAHAHAVKKVLDQQGYITFVYLREGDQAPPFEASVVGRMFAEAGHHIVLDSENARKSQGVWMEAKFARTLGGKPPSSGGGKTNGTGEAPPAGLNGDGEPKGPKPAGPKPAAPATSQGASEIDSFARDVSGWIVTQNPATPGKLFVHRSMSGGMLTDLAFLVKVEKDGSWSVHKPQRSGSGSGFGKRIGSMKKPPSLDIGACSCR
jgi:hypothetical protein